LYGTVRSITGVVQTALTVWSWVVTLALTVLIVVDVLLRYFFSLPLAATWEIGELCMPHIVFLPFAFALAKGSHVRVAMLTLRLGERGRRYAQIFTNLLSIAMCGVLTYFAWRYFWYSYAINEEMLAAVQLLWWWGKIAMPLGMAFFTLRFVFDAIDLIMGHPAK
jgi:TRAP-type C4-dicarboxylate transport system permease small subunit